VTPGARRVSTTADAELAVDARLSSVNAVFTLSLILTQASSPRQAMRLVTTAIPSIAHGQKALAWHPSRSGDYYERAPDTVSDVLAGLAGPGRVEMGGIPSWWAFPLTSRLEDEPVFLMIAGSEPLSDQETFLLSVLAQLCGTVIAKLELIAAERASAQRVAVLNARLESTVSALTRIMEIHRRLNEIVADAGETGIAETLHWLTAFPVVIQDVHGDTRATGGDVPGDHLAIERPGQRRELIRRLRIAHRAVYYRRAWMVLASPRAGVLGVVALIDPARAASEIDLAALEYAATVLSVELARLQSVAEAEFRSQAARERDIAQARAAELAASEARQSAVLEAAHDAVISIDRRARVSYVNSAFTTIFGYRADEVTGRELAEVVVPPSLREAHRQGFARYLATGEPHILDRRLEITAMRADGTEFPAELTVTRTGPAGDPVFTGYVRDITERQRAEQQLMASRARLVAASDTARQRVTRDLHDGAQQRLVTTIINLQLAEQKWESAPQRSRELLEMALGDARRGIEDLREIAAGIHPAALSQRGLAAAIDALTARLPIPVQLEVSERRLPASIEASVYFFCSEALTNVVKHARATSAWVRLEFGDDRCAVEVRDDGIGGAQPRSEMSGLNGLRDRIGALNGTMDITSPAMGGTVLQASIPLPSELRAVDAGTPGDLLVREMLSLPAVGPRDERRAFGEIHGPTPR
jgi:PAS domain S-box-containing protein